jgi:hypothetical protein
MSQGPLRILKTRTFSRWASRELISDAVLGRAVREMQSGLIDARLGSGVFKKRIARTGAGKRGGYRAIVAADLGARWVFLYGFAKNERDSIDSDELQAIRRLAATYLEMDEQILRRLLTAGELVELAHG